MSNLVPMPRQDKNGKTVIRHVKVEVGGHTINVPIPAPHPVANPSQNAVEALRVDLSYSVMEATMDYDSLMDDPEGENDLARNGICDHLQSFPDELVTTIEGLRVNDEAVFHEVARRIEQREPASFISNFIGFRDVAGDDEDKKVAFVRSLNHYPQLEQYGDLRTGGAEVVSKVTALLTVTAAMYQLASEDSDVDEAISWKDHETDPLATPVIDELSDFVLENHERGAEIAKIIEEREVITPEEIRIVLDHPETALSNGAL